MDGMQARVDACRASSLDRVETLTISVKTSKKFHKTRVTDILDTWYQDAGQEVYFFTDSEDANLKARLGDHLTETLCSTGHDRTSLCCKMNHELMFFVKKNASWSCHFDDDNYVNIGRLKTLLFSMNSTLPWYVGKSSTLRPLEISSADGMKLFQSN
ncbi:Fringe-like protein [Ostertagia ostertagi]